MAIADIQINPPMLRLDPGSRKGRFSVSVANQLARDGRLLASIVPVGAARAEWVRIDERYKDVLTVKKDETVVFDVEVAVPPDAAADTYGFKLRVADSLDPTNVWAESEQRDFVVVAGVKPPPPKWRQWALIAGAAVVLIGGAIVLAVAFSKPKPKVCAPACPSGQTCVDGVCKPAAVADAGAIKDAVSGGGDRCHERQGSPCGDCGGVIRCNGTCTKPNPPNFAQPCHPCGQRFDCNGNCPPPPRADYGVVCNACGGTRDCSGNCLPGLPADYGRVKAKFNVVENGAFGQVIAVGGACDRGHVFDSLEIQTVAGTQPCIPAGQDGGSSCAVRVRFPTSGFPFPQSTCQIIVKQRRVCDPR